MELHVCSTILFSRPNTAAMVPLLESQAFCIACARCETSLRPSSNFRVLFATRAENSPSECPATISGRKRSSKLFARITECRNIAGCVTLVCFKSSTLPSNIILVILNPKISLACSNRDLASVEVSYRDKPIPEN